MIEDLRFLFNLKKLIQSLILTDVYCFKYCNRIIKSTYATRRSKVVLSALTNVASGRIGSFDALIGRARVGFAFFHVVGRFRTNFLGPNISGASQRSPSLTGAWLELVRTVLAFARVLILRMGGQHALAFATCVLWTYLLAHLYE